MEAYAMTSYYEHMLRPNQLNARSLVIFLSTKVVPWMARVNQRKRKNKDTSIDTIYSTAFLWNKKNYRAQTKDKDEDEDERKE